MQAKNRIQYLLLISVIIIGSCSKINQPEPSGNLLPPQTSLTGVIQDDFEGQSIVIYANSRYQTMVAFSRIAESGKTLDFHLSPNNFPFIFEDNEGTQWDIFGLAISGPGTGDKLIPVSYQVGFWFSFSSFFPKVTMYGEALNERLDTRFNSSEWLINPDDIKQGASRDGIPSINNPEFDLVVDLFDGSDGPYEDNELMVVIQEEASVKVFPHAILNWHEIVNDTINGVNVALSYCPLTGTSSIWNSQIGSQTLDFGVSGLLYNNNLILYDRNTESLWSQIINQSINGSLKNNIPKRENSVEMNWRGVKQLHKPTLLLSKNTGFSRRYDLYPYGDYRANSNLLFSITYTDDRLHPKERVLAVMIGDKAKVYQFEDFTN
ncbi:MAG: hypothetical protein DRI71_07725 [Bacteroidetes bacterium]|nr:MAG: hypothetical protein DRI71_07725 [Bacteroidota bacterium]